MKAFTKLQKGYGFDLAAVRTLDEDDQCKLSQRVIEKEDNSMAKTRDKDYQSS